MKKYLTLGLLLSVIVLASLFIQPPQTSAQIDNNQCIILTNNLAYGSQDISVSGSVSTLQNYLSTLGYFTSQPTGYFGSITRTAVEKYQAAYSITATGFVGPLTRAYIKTSTCGNTAPITGNPTGCLLGNIYNTATGVLCTAPATSASPVISQLSPSSGPLGTTVIITGSGFSSLTAGTTTIVFDGVDAGAAATASNIKLSFVVPVYQPGYCSQLPSNGGANIQTLCDPIPQVAQGSHTIAIQTSGGTSNTAIFTVTN